MEQIIVALASEISIGEIQQYQQMGYQGEINYDPQIKQVVVTLWRKEHENENRNRS